ncbi:Acyl-CoA wax alcohol acyltransferase 2 [Manis javanica]|nr:Acyl-CoA wax alcohol acyltransferase 2 [Manis javanica]
MLVSSKKDLKTSLEVLAVLQWALSAILTNMKTWRGNASGRKTVPGSVFPGLSTSGGKIVTIVTLGNLYLVVFMMFEPVTVLILTWLAFDWKTPEQGGRRLACVRHWCLWKQHCDYFSIKLSKTHDISPQGQLQLCLPPSWAPGPFILCLATLPQRPQASPRSFLALSPICSYWEPFSGCLSSETVSCLQDSALWANPLWTFCSPIKAQATC